MRDKTLQSLVNPRFAPHEAVIIVGNGLNEGRWPPAVEKKAHWDTSFGQGRSAGSEVAFAIRRLYTIH